MGEGAWGFCHRPGSKVATRTALRPPAAEEHRGWARGAPYHPKRALFCSRRVSDVDVKVHLGLQTKEGTFVALRGIATVVGVSYVQRVGTESVASEAGEISGSHLSHESGEVQAGDDGAGLLGDLFTALHLALQPVHAQDLCSVGLPKVRENAGKDCTHCFRLACGTLGAAHTRNHQSGCNRAKGEASTAHFAVGIIVGQGRTRFLERPHKAEQLGFELRGGERKRKNEETRTVKGHQ